MKKIFFVSIIPFLISCELKNEIPENSYLVTKLRVFDENISPKLNVCTDDTIVDYRNKGNDCMFKLEDMEFEIEYIITLSGEGYMTKFENHTVTNRINYEKFDIEKDTIDPRKLNGLDISIKFNKSRDKIIDGTDTLNIERVFPNEKLIFVENKNMKKGRRDIYEYK